MYEKKWKSFVFSDAFLYFCKSKMQSQEMNGVKSRLLGMTQPELKEMAVRLGLPAFTGGQIAQWLYEKHVCSINDMTNISKQNRERLKETVSAALTER